MHELSIALALMEEVATLARQRLARRVKRVTCRIGTLRQVDRTTLREALEIARGNDSITTDAEMDVRMAGMDLCCRSCGHHVELPTWTFECPACGSADIRLSGGEELELTSLDLELPDEEGVAGSGTRPASDVA